MANLVSGWTEGDKSYLVEREGDGIRIRTVPARWAFFVTGLDDTDRANLARDRRVIGVKQTDGGKYTRVDCKNRWGRKDIVEILERAARRTTGVEILEADVTPIVRLLADVPSLQVDPEPRLGFLDLETDSRVGFNGAREGNARILSWAITDSSGERAASAVLEGEATDSPQTLDRNERALIGALLDAADRFDVLIAWNGDGFDFPVIQMRASVLGMETRRGQPIAWNRWCWLDHLEVFKKYNMHSDGGGEQKTSFKLDHVATYLLGEGKDEFDATRTWEAWAAGGEERARLLRYNVKDTALLPRIEAATGFLALHLAVCHICRVFADTHSLHATAQGDGFLLRLGADYGYRWATRPEFGDNPPAPFKGAFVMEPKRLGAVDNVHVCDFAGLYPSIMRTWNMSPDTKLPRRAETVKPGVPHVEPGVCQLPNRATWFRTDKDGMFRIALDTLVAKRAEYTAEMKKHPAGTVEHERYKRLSGAFKIVANSFYGITGSPYSRFFDPEIAEGVTQTGKWLLENVISEATARKLDPFYGDTDSVFVAGEAEVMRALVEHMNETWGQRLEPWGILPGAPNHVDLDFEKTFRRIVIVSAKRYAGAYLVYKGKPALETAKPEVKGLEFKRGDTIRLAREMQSEVVHTLLRPGPIPAPHEIRAIVDRYRERVLRGELTLDDVRITQSLTKRVEEYADRYNSDRCRCGYSFDGVGPDGPETCPSCNVVRAKTAQPAHVRVARLLKERGEPLGEGARVAYIIVGRTNTIEAIPAGDPGALERADRSFYWENRIYPATERILEHVYPQVRSWGESKVERKQRVQEINGQGTLDFAAERFAASLHDRLEESRMTEGLPAPEVGEPSPVPVVLPGGRIRRKKVPAPQPSSAPAPSGRIRRRRQSEPTGIVFTIVEDIDAQESPKHRRMLVAVKAAIEAHPGDTPVTVRVRFPATASVDIPTGLGIARTREARLALERLAGPGSVTGFPG